METFYVQNIHDKQKESISVGSKYKAYISESIYKYHLMNPALLLGLKENRYFHM
jgi:hypothetical protein